MKKIHILIYGIYLVILTLCANAFPILSKNLAFLWLFIPIFTLLNLFAGIFSIKTKSLRLRICHHGAITLAIFLPSACISVIHHIILAFRLIPSDHMTWILNALFCFTVYLIIFWNGIICVYLTSVQLGVKQRMIGLICGMIPVANLFCLISIIGTTLREVDSDLRREQLNSTRLHLRLCETKYPILLVHGVCFRDSKILSYWGRIPRELEAHGAKIYYGNHRSAASIAVCAEELSARIKQILAETGAEKVNIIAHSKGGLDCRYAISKLGMGPYVASFTTINSPHKGCRYADVLLTVLPSHFKNKVSRIYNRAMRHLGDIDPDFLTAMCNLSASFCEKFNEEMDDSEEKFGIYRRSVGSVMASARAESFPLSLFYHIVNEFDGPNDGLVCEDSFAFGEDFVLLKPKGKKGISHMDVIDLARRDLRDFDVREFYVEMVNDLKNRGY